MKKKIIVTLLMLLIVAGLYAQVPACNKCTGQYLESCERTEEECGHIVYKCVLDCSSSACLK